MASSRFWWRVGTRFGGGQGVSAERLWTAGLFGGLFAAGCGSAPAAAAPSHGEPSHSAVEAAPTTGGARAPAVVTPAVATQTSPQGDNHGHARTQGHPDERTHDHHEHSFADAERYAKHFDSPERAAWQKPEEVVGLMAITPGMHVADLGAGTGYFLPHLSRAVGKDGLVVGLDVEPAMVEYMQHRVTREQMLNTRVQRVSSETLDVAAASLDRILIVNTWHHLPKRVPYARQLSKVLRPSGAVIIVDFTRESPMGPPEKYRFTVEQVTEELTAGGFRVQVLEESLPYQFVLRATPE